MTLYPFGGTPDSYIEDRDTSDRLGGVALTILDAQTLTAVTGLLDEGGSSTSEILTDDYGYWAFSCESPSVVVEVTDSLGTHQWGPMSSPAAVREAVGSLSVLSAQTAAALAAAAAAETSASQALAAASAPVIHSATTGRDATGQHPIAAISGLQAALDALSAASSPGGVAGIVYAVAPTYAVDTTGATSSVAGLLAAFSAVPQGGKLVIPPGTYRIDSVLMLQNKHVVIEAWGAHFIYTSATAAIVMQGSMGTTYNVSSVTENSSTSYARGEQLPITTLSLASAPSGWAVGDYVKVAADNFVPPSNSNVRSGQVMQVISVSGSTVVLDGWLRDTYTTNVRVAKMPSNSTGAYRMEWYGGTGYHDSTVMASGTMGYALLQASRLVEPVISGWRVVNASGPAIYLGHTFKARVLHCSAHRLLDGGSVYGYGVDDGGEFSLVVGFMAERVRHAYTSGPSQASAGGNVGDFGRVHGAVVLAGIAHGCTQVAWDTHGDADSVQFIGCQAIDCYYGFQLRGTRHRIVGGRVLGPCYPGAVQVTTAATTSLNSWGHFIGGGLVLEDIQGDALVFNSESDESGNLPNIVDGVAIYNRLTTKRIIATTNCPVQYGRIVVPSGGTRYSVSGTGSIAAAPTFSYP